MFLVDIKILHREDRNVKLIKLSEAFGNYAKYLNISQG